MQKNESLLHLYLHFGKVKGESFNDYSSGHSFGGNTFGDTYGQGIVVSDKEETTSTTPGYYEYIYGK